MKKEFIESDLDNSFKISDICCALTNYAKDYIEENDEKNSIRDAILIDLINNIGYLGDLDFSLCIDELHNKKRFDENIIYTHTTDNDVLTILFSYLPKYLFDGNPVDSIVSNNYLTNVREKFDIELVYKNALDFINYICTSKGFERQFSLNEIYKKYEDSIINLNMQELKRFLQLANSYRKILLVNNIKSVYEYIRSQYNADEINNKYFWSCSAFKSYEDKLYALAYAYGKMSNNKSHIKEIDNRIREMKRR